MPTALEQFIQKAREASMSVADLTGLVQASEIVFKQFDAEIAKGSGILAGRIKRQTELGEKLAAMAEKPLETAGYTQNMVARQKENLDARIKEAEASLKILKTQRKEALDVTPSTQVIGAAKAYDDLKIKLEENQQMQANVDRTTAEGESRFAAFQQTIDGLAKALELAKAKLIDYKQTLQTLRYIDQGGNSPRQILDLIEIKQEELGREREGILKSVSFQSKVDPTGKFTSTTIYPPGAKERLNEIDAAIQRLTDSYKKFYAILGEVNAETLKGTTLPQNQAPPETGGRTPAQQRAEEILRVTKETYETQEKYLKAKEFAATKGFHPETVPTILDSGIAGVQKLTYFEGAEKSISGVNQQLQLFIDKAGNVLPNTSRQFNTFASSIVRDIVELTKWTIAIGVIYGPLRKFQEMVTKMIANEALLASSMIVLAESTTKASDVFKIAADAANMMGVDVGGTIDVFTQAYRATGGLGDQYTRIATASSLMTSGIMLAKLSGMSYNEAIDNLTGSLQQVGLGLDQGTKLLDKWVATSKVANVDIGTLAIGFATVSEAADSAGIDVDKLNGLLAIISQSLAMTGSNAANTARGLISGFQSDKAVKAMQQLGIAAQDTEGNMRPVLDLMGEIYSMKNLGLISDTAFSKLTQQIGGGWRRGTQVAAIINDTAKIYSVAEASANANGDAQEALAKKLDTVQTAATRLNNSFQSLAATLGDSGGVLDLFKGILEFTNAIVKGVDALSGSIGKVAPILMTTLAAGALFKARPDIMTSLLGGIAGFGNIFAPASKTGRVSYAGGEGQVSVGGGDRLALALMGRQLGSSLLIGGLMSAYPAISNLTTGKPKEAAADIGGGIVGAIVGNLAGPGGAYIGAVIGQAIAEAFVKAAEPSLEIVKYGPGTGTAYPKTGPSTKETIEEDLVAILTANQKPLPFAGIEGAPGIAFGPDMANRWSKVLEAAGKFAASRMKEHAPEGYVAYAPSAQEILYQNATPEAQVEYNRRIAAARAAGQLPTEGVPSYFQDEQARIAKQNAFATAQRKNREQELINQLNLGRINPTEYATRMGQIKNFETVAAGWQEALGDQFKAIDKDIKSTTDEYQKFIDIMTYGSVEQVDAINTVVSEIGDLITQIHTLQQLNPNVMQDYTANGITTQITAAAKIKLLTDQLNQLLSYGGNLMAGVSTAVQIQKKPIPGIFNQGQAMTGDIAGAAARAREMEAQFLRETAGYTDAEIKIYRESLDNLALAIDEGGNLVWKNLADFGEKVGGDWFQKAIDEFIASGKITVVVNVATQTMGWGGRVDYTKAESERIQSQVVTMEDFMIRMGMSPTDIDRNYVQLVQFEDGQWGVQRGDRKAWEALLGQILETEQKQLDGMYNLPEGATFWVPLTAAYYRRGGAGGGGGGGTIDNTPLVDAGANLDDAAAALKAAGQILIDAAIAQGKGGIIPIPTGRNKWESYIYEPPAERTPGEIFSPKIEDYFFRHLKETTLPGAIPKETVNYFPKGWGPEIDFKSLWNSIMQFFNDLKNLQLPDLWGKTSVAPTGLNTNLNTAPISRINIKIDTKSQLLVDGRTLATVIKPYIMDDILRAQRGHGTYTAVHVV
jgi:TP901 family phage tail tape measure protein